MTRIAEDIKYWQDTYRERSFYDNDFYFSSAPPSPFNPHTMEKIKVYCKLFNSTMWKRVTPAELDHMVEQLASMHAKFWSHRDGWYVWEPGDYYFHLSPRKGGNTRYYELLSEMAEHIEV